MSLTPKPVLLLGAGGTFPVPILIDTHGVVAVSPPHDATGNIAALVQLNGVAIPTSGTYGLETASIAFGANVQSGVYDALNEDANNYDGQPANLLWGNLLTNAQNYGYNGLTFDRVRIANVFKTLDTNATGPTAVWTPTAGKKFRLMGYTISVAGTAAATGPILIKLLDSATLIKQHRCNVIQTTTANISGGDTQIGVSLGQGQLSSAANNVLNISLSVALATGGCSVNVWGTEE